MGSLVMGSDLGTPRPYRRIADADQDQDLFGPIPPPVGIGIPSKFGEQGVDQWGAGRSGLHRQEAPTGHEERRLRQGALTTAVIAQADAHPSH